MSSMRMMQSKEEVFMSIRENLFGVNGQDNFEKLIQDQLAEAHSYHGWMDATPEDFLWWSIERDAEEIQGRRINRPPTAQQFWTAAYEYGGANSEVVKMTTTGLAGPYPIGKLYGKYPMKLMPTLSALPAHAIERSGWSAPFGFAPTDSGAISYPDGHPSGMWDPAYMAKFSKGPMRTLFRAQDDDKLRRFSELGWVLMKNAADVWEKTGHVLVIDMDDRDTRHRHPWLVLASEWPTDGEETGDGQFTIRAAKDVMRDDPTQLGVFPGDNNRTPICKIVPWDREMKEGERILEQLGEDFSFGAERKGGHRDWRKTDKGPALARIMEWFWDPKAQEQVCYNKDGREWMRYIPQTQEYYFSIAESIESVIRLDGELGFFGELHGMPVIEVPPRRQKPNAELEEKLRGREWPATVHPPKRPRISSGPQF
ncbi:MAG: hypothetical protein Q9197_000549 [Variospora fuerteventurae]